MNAQARHVTGAKTETPQSIAQRLYDEAGGDEEMAIERLANYADALPSLRWTLLRIAARHLVGGVRRTDNANIVRQAYVVNVPGHAKAAERALAVAGIVGRSLMDMRFKVDGTVYVLGDSTADELRPVAAHYVGQGATMLRTGRWLERIIAATPDGKRVRDAMRIKEVERLKKEADAIPV